MIEIGLYVLLVVMIIGALAALEFEDLFSSVIVLGGVGLALSLAFLLLQAPDLALVQFITELLVLLILIKATARKDFFSSRTQRGYISALIVALFVLVLAYFGFLAFKELPAFGTPLMKTSPVKMLGIPSEEGGGNIVSRIMFEYRGLDTVGELTILFTAALAALTLLRKVGRIREKEDTVSPKNPDPESRKGGLS